jgi:uncharacterized protein
MHRSKRRETVIYREYGKTGKKVSMLGFGGMRFSNVDDREACTAMMVEAAKGGVNYFDTAPGYFSTRSEQAFGDGFRELARQGLPYFCSTKTFAVTESAIRKELDGQLKRLGVSAVDFYHIWCITSVENWRGRRKDGILETFRKLKEEKLIRHICVSSHLIGDEIKELLMEGVFEGVLFGYSAYNFNTRQAAFDAIAAKDLGCVVMNPLGGGIIPRNPKIFDFIRMRPEESVVEAALRFLFSHERIDVSLVGFSTVEQVRESLKAVERFQPLSAAELDRIKKGIRGAFGELCTGCQYCDECPQEIRIPQLMDAYNQKRLSGQDQDLLNRLSWHWNLEPSEAAKCTECGHCEEACTQHLPIMARLKEIAAVGAAAAKAKK